MRKPRTPLIWLFMIALAGTVTSLRVYSTPPHPGAEMPRAFLQAAWGMSKQQVREANRLPLERTASSQRFYTPPEGSDASRYETWQSEGQRFLGRPATVYYTFLNGRLFTYHVFITDSDADRLDSDMRRYLLRKFGPQFSTEEDPPPARTLWQFKDFIVNYWLYEQELSLVGRYKAGYGVLYRPLENPASVDS